MLAIEHRVVGSRTRNALLRHSHRELLAQQTRIPFLWLSAIRVADVDVRCGAEDAQMGALRVHVVVHLATPLWSRLAAALAQLVCADRRRNDRQHSAYELRAGRGITRVKFMYSTAVACEGETNLNGVCACCMLTLSLVSTTVRARAGESEESARERQLCPVTVLRSGVSRKFISERLHEPSRTRRAHTTHTRVCSHRHTA